MLLARRSYSASVVKRSGNIIGLTGVCEDRNSSFMTGSALAPNIIREWFRSDSTNFFSELGCDISNKIVDYGDISPATHTADGIITAITPLMKELHEKKHIPVTLGGDHSITYALTKVLSTLKEPFKIIHFDAHPDLYDDFQGNPNSHASPFARICEQRTICSSLLSVGVRTINQHQREQLDKFNIKLIEARHISDDHVLIKKMLQKHLHNQDNIYVSIDIDVLDPAYAPGVSHREPGGLTTRQLINFIHAIPGNIIGADIVEYNPSRDVDHMTAMVVAKLLKELSGRIVVG